MIDNKPNNFRFVRDLMASMVRGALKKFSKPALPIIRQSKQLNHSQSQPIGLQSLHLPSFLLSWYSACWFTFLFEIWAVVGPKHLRSDWINKIRKIFWMIFNLKSHSTVQAKKLICVRPFVFFNGTMKNRCLAYLSPNRRDKCCHPKKIVWKSIEGKTLIFLGGN